MRPDPDRRLAECPLVIFIAYTVGPDAEERGYSDWLRQVDMPFFNAIPGTLHYANWRVTGVRHGTPPIWDYFDFQGLVDEDDLSRVWFNPDLDGFRSNWLKLWGYGKKEAPPVLRHSYLMRPVHRSTSSAPSNTLCLSGGTGPAPQEDGPDILFRVDGILHKHFGGAEGGKSWLTPVSDLNPLGLDWIGVSYGSQGTPPPDAALVAQAALIAAPDREGHWPAEHAGDPR